MVLEIRLDMGSGSRGRGGSSYSKVPLTGGGWARKTPQSCRVKFLVNFERVSSIPFCEMCSSSCLPSHEGLWEPKRQPIMDSKTTALEHKGGSETSARGK